MTLVELLIALVLTGVMASAVLGLVLLGQRAYRRQHAMAAVSATLRTAATMLPLELAGLDALVAAEPGAVSFQATRTLSFACAPPRGSGPRTGSLTVATEPRYGMRVPDSRRDSVLVYAEADPTDNDDDHWVRADLVAVRGGVTCSDGSAGRVFELAAVSPSWGLRDVYPGAPVLTTELIQLAAYRDRGGTWWLGVRGRTKARGWSAVQPVLGPLAPHGLGLAYLTAAGAAAGPGETARIGVRLVARAPAAWGAVPLRDSVWIEVALRNRHP